MLPPVRVSTCHPDVEREDPLISPVVVNRHRRILRRYLWTRRESIHQVPELVAQGANNALYRIYLNEKPVLAKIGMNPFYRKLHIEYAVLRQVAPLSPEPIDFFNDARSGLQVLLLKQLDGRHPDVLEDTDIAAIGRIIAAFHTGIPPIDAVPTEQGMSFIRNRVLQVRSTGGLQTYRDRFKKLYDVLLGYADRPGVTPHPDQNVLVHGDLVPRNIIMEPDGAARIIDWEGARYDVPEADLATFLKAYRITGARREHFFSAYGLPVDRNRFALRLAVHYLQVIAWRLTMQLSREYGKRYDEVVAELDEELDIAEELIERLH